MLRAFRSYYLHNSADFIDAEYLEGLVSVYKVNGVTRTRQLSTQELYNFCIQSGAPRNKTSSKNIAEYYSTKIFPDQLKGFFAETIILVEGETEFFLYQYILKGLVFLLLNMV